MKYTVDFTTQFKKDLKKASKQGKSIDALFEIVEHIANGDSLDPKYHLHQLTGQYKGCFECHIEPDWLLVYRVYQKTLILLLARIGSHSELFD